MNIPWGIEKTLRRDGLHLQAISDRRQTTPRQETRTMLVHETATSSRSPRTNATRKHKKQDDEFRQLPHAKLFLEIVAHKLMLLSLLLLMQATQTIQTEIL